MQLRQRVWILPIFSLVIIVVFIIGMATVFYFNKQAQNKFEEINSTYVPVNAAIADIRKNMQKLQDIFEEVVITNDAMAIEDAAAFEKNMNLALAKVEHSLPFYPGAQDLRSIFTSYYAQALQLAELMLQKHMDQLTTETTKVVIYREEFERTLSGLETYLQTQYRVNATNTQQQMSSLTWIVFGMILVLSLVLTIGSFIVMRTLSSRLTVLSQFAKQVEDGNYDTTFSTSWNDEFSNVVSAFNSMVSSIRDSTEQLNRLAKFDTLTEVYNRNALIERLEVEIRSASRHKYPLSFCMCDVDKFKTVNDTYGHETGDQVLTEFAMALKAVLRTEDIIGRYGGDEFSIIFPHTNAKSACVALDRVRSQISEKVFKDRNGNEFHVTCSFGISCYVEKMDSKDFMRAADDALYQSKEKGRNTITITQ